MSDAPAPDAQPQPSMRFTKTFKKYTAEHAPEVCDHVREWADATEGVVFHEDKSIVKVTADEAAIKGLLAALRESFDYVPPEDREGASKKKA